MFYDLISSIFTFCRANDSMTKAQQNQRPISDVRVVGGSLRSITLNAGEDPAQNPAGGPHLATPPQV